MKNIDWGKISTDLLKIIDSNPGATRFITRKSSFENWIQVEMAGILVSLGYDINVEDYKNGNCDIVFGDTGIEIKLFISRKHSYKRIDSDIEKLQNNISLKDKYVFVVGIDLDNSEWGKYFLDNKYKSTHPITFRTDRKKGIELVVIQITK